MFNDLSHEIWAVAQLLPDESIEDGVERIKNILIETLKPPHNSNYTITSSFTPKVCPQCASKNYHQETCEKCNILHYYCNNCRQIFT